MPRLTTPRRDDGVGLPELLVVITITAILGTVVLTGILRAFRTSAEGQERVYALTDLTMAAERVARELRAADPVLLATATRVHVEVLRGGALERHDFEAVEGTLRHTVTRYTDVQRSAVASTAAFDLVPGLVVPGSGVFTFAADDGTAWTDGQPYTELARIAFSLGTDLSGQEPLSLSTAVHVRNRAT